MTLLFVTVLWESDCRTIHFIGRLVWVPNVQFVMTGNIHSAIAVTRMSCGSWLEVVRM
jgi:hypothetical protein